MIETEDTLDTLPKFLARNYERWGDRRVALLRKEFGIWQRYTWKDYYEQVKYFCLGLMSLGFHSGDKIAIMGDNAPEWIWAEVAAQAARGAAVGIYTDCTPEEVKYIVKDSEADFAVAGDQEQVDKLLQIKDEIPQLKKIVYWDAKGLSSYGDPILIYWEEVIGLGRDYEKAHPGLSEQTIKEGKGEDIAIVLYTSGTTGVPKGVTFSHGALVIGTLAWMEWSGIDESYQRVSFYPPAWILEQLEGITLPLCAGERVCYPECPDSTQADLRERGPDIFFASSRVWEGLASTVQAKIADADSVKRFFYHLLLPVGYKIAALHFQGEDPNLFWRALYAMANLLVMRPLRDKLGILNVRQALSAGALLSPDAITFFTAMGVPIKQAYGLTEMTPITTQRKDDRYDRSTISSGLPIPGVEIRINDDSEILARGRMMFSGYYKKPELNKLALSSQGWLHTGDAGYLDGTVGYVVIMDRKQDLLTLSSGARFSPQFIESCLRFSPYISDAMITGGKDNAYVAALINIDLQNVGRWAEGRNIPYTTFTDLSQKPEIYDLVEREIRKVNQSLPKETRIRKFINFYKQFDPDEAELTRTRKLRRSYMEKTYSNIIDNLYSDKSYFEVQTEVKYRDGRKGLMKAEAKIKSVGD